MSIDELWDIWESEADAAMAAKQAGMLPTLYKVAGLRRVVGVLDVESPDELDRISGLPMAHVLDFVEIVPVRPYEAFAADVRARWKQDVAAG